jgi:hypothetical protein
LKLDPRTGKPLPKPPKAEDSEDDGLADIKI